MGTDPRLNDGATFAGRYRIDRALKVGGQGAVYAARNTETGYRVALKVMLPSLVQSAAHRARFEQEARIGNSFASPYFVQVIDAGVDHATNMPWMAMEMLQGRDLDDACADGALLPLETARKVFQQVGLALSVAHAADPPVVHLDLKPANLFLHRTNRHCAARSFEAALADVNAAVALCPDDAGVRLVRSDVHLRRNDLRAAEEDARFAVTRHPDDVVARAALASVRVAAGDWPMAVVELTAALMREPAHRELLARRAQCFRALGMQWEAAIDEVAAGLPGDTQPT